MQNKKLLGSALALAMLLPYSQAYADVLKNVKVDGSIDLQATSANNVTDFSTSKYDQIGDAQARLMLNTGFDLLDDVHAMTTLTDNNFHWGQNNGAAGIVSGPGSNSQQMIGGNTTGLLDSILLDQAYIKIDKVFGAVDVTLGRQFYGNPGDMIIYFGPYQNLFGLAVSAIDAARFDWSNDMIGLTGLAGKFNIPTMAGPLGTSLGGTTHIGSDATQVDVQGLNLTIKGNSMANGGAYVWEKETHLSAVGAAPSANDYLYVAGLKGKVSAGPAYLKAEVAKDFGENRTALMGPTAANYDGWAVKADVGAKADLGVASVEPWGEFADASGGANNNKNYQFAGINPDYRPGGIYGFFSSLDGMTGDMSTFSNGGVGDRTIWGAGLKATPAALSKLTMGVAYWDYYFQSALGEQEELGTTAAAGNKHIGSEADVNLTWKHSDNVAFNVAAGEFWAGGAVNGMNLSSGSRTGGASTATLFSFDTSVKF